VKHEVMSWRMINRKCATRIIAQMRQESESLPVNARRGLDGPLNGGEWPGIAMVV
jgi:hypothetical protein